MGYKLSDQLRVVIRLSGEKHSDICRGAEIQPATLSRFVSGQAGLSFGAIDRLCEYFGVWVISRKEWDRRERLWRMYKDGLLVRKNPANT